jgi:hypothetical protein
MRHVVGLFSVDIGHRSGDAARGGLKSGRSWKGCMRLAILFATALAVMSNSAWAEQLVLNLNPQSSQLTGVAFVPALQVNATAQDPNGESVTTTYSGTITIDVDNLMNPTSIEFVSGNVIAANSGNWLPDIGGGSEGDPDVDGDADPGTAAPANYGFFLDAGAIGQLYAASRDTILSLNATPKTLTGSQFDPFGITLTVAQGIYESNINSPVFGDDAGTDDITDEAGTNCTDMAGSVNRCGTMMGSYAVAGGTATLSLPLNFILGEGDDVEVTFTGMFVATASLSQPLLGDYNENGVVDAADYVMWRDNEGTTNTLPNDNIGGTIGAAHYNQWKENFGESTPGGFGSASVPEPASLALVMVGTLSWWIRRRTPQR